MPDRRERIKMKQKGHNKVVENRREMIQGRREIREMGREGR